MGEVEGQRERWVLDVLVGKGGGGGKGQCERWGWKCGWAGGAKGWVLDVLLRGGWMGAG